MSDNGRAMALRPGPRAHGVRISVICTVRDEEVHARAAVSSALSPDVFELIVVDDGSTDGTLRVLERLAAEDRRVKIIGRPAIGRGPAIALAFGESRGEFVVNIDADDAIHPGWVSLGAAILRDSPELAVVAAAPRYVANAEPITWPPVNGTPPPCDVTAALAFYNPVTHSSVIMRRQAVESVGGYDPGRQTHVDYDLWIRLAGAGWRLGTVNARLVAKRLHPGQKFELRNRLPYLWASAAIQAKAIRAVGGGPAAWASIPARLAWGLLPRVLRMSVRRAVSTRPPTSPSFLPHFRGFPQTRVPPH